MPGRTVGERIAKARQDIGISQTLLARRAGLSPGAISLLESGASKSLASENVFPIADALNVSARWLLTGRSPRPIDGATPLPHENADVMLLARHLATLDSEKVQAVMLLLGGKLLPSDIRSRR